MHEAKRAPHLVVGDLGWGRGRAGGTALLRSRMGDWQNQKSWLETPGLGWLVFQEELERVGCFIIRGVDGACRPSHCWTHSSTGTLPGTAGRGTTGGTSPAGGLYASLTLLFLRRGAV